MKSFLALIAFFSFILLINSMAWAVTAGVQANGAGGTVSITPNDSLSITVGLDAEGSQANADWWLAASTDSGWYYYDARTGTWTAGLNVTLQGPLADVASAPVLNISGLPIGAYTFYFGVDSNMNGSPDGQLVYDSVAISVVDPNSRSTLYVDVYDPNKACDGVTLFADLHDSSSPRLVAVSMTGNIVWEYRLPDELKQYTNPGLDVELLSNGHILFELPLKGVYEIDLSGNTVWSHLNPKISHDVDRLSNGNTLYVFGGNDQFSDRQVKEVNSAGEIVWSWCATNGFFTPAYTNIYDDGWTHANAVSRLSGGNTLVNLRNFSMTVEVNPGGSIVWSNDWARIGGTNCDPHEPEVHTNNHLLVCLQNNSPYQLVEIDRATGATVWTYARSGLRTTRDGDRLPNGNTLVVGVLTQTCDSVIFEITSDGEIVWQLKLKDAPVSRSPGWFYKADRIPSE